MARTKEGLPRGTKESRDRPAPLLCTSLLGAWAGVGIREGFIEVAGAEG